MKFISKSATVEVNNFTELSVTRMDNNVALNVWHKPTYGERPILFATLLGHVGRLSYDKDGLVWTDTDRYLGAGSTLLRFKSPAGYIGSSKQVELEAVGDTVTAVSKADGCVIAFLAYGTEGWIEVY